MFGVLTFFIFSEPERVRLDVFINPDTWETIHVEWMGLKGLPD